MFYNCKSLKKHENSFRETKNEKLEFSKPNKKFLEANECYKKRED